jgi:hypothetical protein
MHAHDLGTSCEGEGFREESEFVPRLVETSAATNFDLQSWEDGGYASTRHVMRRNGQQ